MSQTIQYRGDTSANWESVNPVLFDREVGLETDTFKAKMGDGSTHWTSLPYWTLGTLAVLSVFGRTGNVVGQTGDYTAAQVGALAIIGGNMQGWVGPKEVTVVPSGGNININAQLGNSFIVPLAASGSTVNVPSNPSAGQKIEIEFQQDPTGSRTVSWASGWNFGAGSAPTLTTTPGAIDVLGFKYSSLLSAWCFIGMASGFSPPPQNIVFTAAVGSPPSSPVGNSVSVVLPGALAVGNAVVIGVCAAGNGNVVPAGFTFATTGASTPTQFGNQINGSYGDGSAIYGFYVQAGDLSEANGGTAGSNATLTVTATGTASGYTPAIALSGYSGALLPPGSQAQSTTTSTVGSPSPTYVFPTVATTANGSYEISVSMMPDNANLTTTVPGSLTGRTVDTNQIVIADSNASVGNAGTTIGGETWTNQADANVIWHAHTIALDAV